MPITRQYINTMVQQIHVIESAIGRIEFDRRRINERRMIVEQEQAIAAERARRRWLRQRHVRDLSQDVSIAAVIVALSVTCLMIFI